VFLGPNDPPGIEINHNGEDGVYMHSEGDEARAEVARLREAGAELACWARGS